MRVYLSGPMRGLPNGNQEAFEDAAEDLRMMGHQVIMPKAMPESVFEELYPKTLANDIVVLAYSEVDALVLMQGWHDSGGARTELAYARAVGMPVYLLSWDGQLRGTSSGMD